MVFSVGQKLRQFAQGAADAVPDDVLVFFGERFQQRQCFDGGGVSSLHQSEQVVDEAQTVEGRKSSLTDGSYQLFQ